MLNAAAREITCNILSDIESGCLCEVERARTSFYSEIRGLTIHQRFYIYPSGNIVGVNSVDGGYEAFRFDSENADIFRHHYKEFF